MFPTETYLDQLANAIRRDIEPDASPDDEFLPLYRIYAVLLLAKGDAVTGEDVHDAWVAWATATQSDRAHLIPYAELTPAVQALDEPFAAAIRAVAARRRA